MARSQNPLTGKMSGTVGNFVMSSSRGQNIVRSKAFQPRDAKSEAQIKHRGAFSLLSDEYTALSSFVKDSFPNRAKNQSAYNAFMAVNLSEAVDKSGDAPVLDYSRMAISKGSLPRVNVQSATVEAEGLKLSYQTQSVFPGVAADDVVTAVLRTTEGAVYAATKTRGEGETDSLVIPWANGAAEAVKYVYVFVMSADKAKASQNCTCQPEVIEQKTVVRMKVCMAQRVAAATLSNKKRPELVRIQVFFL